MGQGKIKKMGEKGVGIEIRIRNNGLKSAIIIPIFIKLKTLWNSVSLT